MATISASKSKTLTSSNSRSYTLTASFTEGSYSVANNTSPLTLTATLAPTTSRWSTSYNSTLAIYWYDNYTGKETLVGSTTFAGLSSTSDVKSVTKSYTVKHKTNGSLSGYAKAVFTKGSTTSSYAPASGNVSTATTALTTIPRASSISLTGSALGSAVSVAITRASTSFTHKIEYKIGSSSYVTVSSSATTSASFTPATATYASQNTTGTTVTCTVRCTTYNGSSTVGSAVTKNITLSIPTSVIPTCSAITLTRVNNGVPSNWGVYVKGYSKVTASISGTGIYGSTISSYYLSGAGKTVSTSSFTSGVLSSSGTYSFSAYVKDSRGRQSATSTNSITVYDYAKPSLTFTAKRCDASGNVSNTGIYLKVKTTYTYSSVNGKNSISGKITCGRFSTTSLTNGSEVVLAASLATTSAYTATCTITDGLGNTATANVSIPTASIPFMLRDDETGAAFGGYSTRRNAFESFWNMYLYGYLYMDNDRPIRSKTTDGTLLNVINVSTSNNTTFGYGGYYNAIGSSNIYGNGINLYTKTGLIYSDSDIVLDNKKNIYGRTTDKTSLSLIGVNSNNDIGIGWGSYYNSLGGTYLYGNSITLWANTFINLKNTLVTKNSESIMGLDSSGNKKALAGVSESDNLYIGSASADYATRNTNVYGGYYINLGACRGQDNTANIINIFREQSGDLRTIMRPNVTGGAYLGTDGYRWNTAFFTNAITASDLKEKSIIEDFDFKAKDFVMNMKPIAYRRTGPGDTGKRIHIGFGAQTLNSLIKDLELGDLSMVQATILSEGTVMDEDENGKPVERTEIVETPYTGQEDVEDEDLAWGINYTELIPYLFLMVQEQQKEIDQLKELVYELTNANK